MKRAPHVCDQQGCPQLVPAGAGRKCPQHRRDDPGKFSSVRNSRARTSTAGHRARRASTLRVAGGRCQIRYPNICTGDATVFDHIISLKMYGLLPADIRANVTVDMLNAAPWNRQAACEKCSRRKASLEGHYLAGHNVARPYDLSIIPQHVLDGPPANTFRTPRPINLCYNADDR
jgi:5-methylcytosine-specific restriction endonuclease McrA